MVESSVKLSPRGKALIWASSTLIALAFIAPSYESFTTLLSTGLTLILLLTVLRYQLYFKIASLKKLRFNRVFEGYRIEGEELRVRVEVENDTVTSLGHVETYDSPPRTFRVKGKPSAVLSLPAKSRSTLEYHVIPVIGRHLFEKLDVILRDPIGAYYYEAEVPLKSQVEIKPKISALTSKVLARTVSAPYGTAKFKRRGVGLEFSDVREYVPGDEVRRIEWKATARTGELKTKEYELEAHLRVIFVLDASKSMMQGVVGGTKLEYSSRAIGFVAKNLLDRGDYVGLTVYLGSKTEPIQVPLSRGRKHLTRVLNVISKIAPVDDDKSGLGRAVQNSIMRSYRKKGNLIIVISDLEFKSEYVLREFLEKLKTVRESLNRIVIISPYTPLFEVETLAGLGKLIYRIYAARSWRERKRITREFEKLEIPVLNVGLKDVVEVLLNRLEEERRIASV